MSTVSAKVTTVCYMISDIFSCYYIASLHFSFHFVKMTGVSDSITSNIVCISWASKITDVFCRFWAIWRAHRQCQLGSSSGITNLFIIYTFLQLILFLLHQHKSLSFLRTRQFFVFTFTPRCWQYLNLFVQQTVMWRSVSCRSASHCAAVFVRGFMWGLMVVVRVSRRTW